MKQGDFYGIFTGFQTGAYFNGLHRAGLHAEPYEDNRLQAFKAFIGAWGLSVSAQPHFSHLCHKLYYRLHYKKVLLFDNIGGNSCLSYGDISLRGKAHNQTAVPAQNIRIHAYSA